MAKSGKPTTEGRLDVAIELLQHLLAVELYTKGVKQEVIAKHLHVATAKVTKMLEGIKREK